ncbi:hypothetical protein VTH06DRAFT_4411 [Thermothelomyces fergusii]
MCALNDVSSARRATADRAAHPQHGFKSVVLSHLRPRTSNDGSAGRPCTHPENTGHTLVSVLPSFRVGRKPEPPQAGDSSKAKRRAPTPS